MTKKHSHLGASIAKRWIECPGSVAACAGRENVQTPYAAEGTAAHALAEQCLRKKHHPERYLGQWIDLKGGFYAEEAQVPEGVRRVSVWPVDEDMVEAVELYVDFAEKHTESGDEVEFEQRIDLSQFHPDLFGTADLVIYKPKAKKLIVADYKHGRGVAVEAKENVQGLYYAAGAAFKMQNRGISSIDVVIVQPRCAHKDGPIRTWTTTAMDMLDFVADLVEHAKATEKPNAPLRAGDWCKFCPAAATCPALAEAALKAAQADFAPGGDVVLSRPDSYDPAALATALANVHLIESWCHSVKKFAHDEALAGRTPPGWKLVNTRATRRWRDEAAVLSALDVRGYEQTQYMTEPELKSVAQLEKAIGKKGFAAFTALVELKSSGVVLAPESDKRPAVRPDAAEEFGGA